MKDDVLHTGRSRKLVRQFRKFLKNTEPETTVAALLDRLEQDGGEDALAEALELLRRFPEFLDVVEKSYAEYEDRLKTASRNIEFSSHELNTAFRELENLHSSMNAMMDSLDEGLLFFGEDGVCAPVFSRACKKLLECDPGGRHLSEVLDFDGEKREEFDMWLSVVFDGANALGFDDLDHLAPGSYQTATGRMVDLAYKPMYVGQNTLSGIMLIATDRTIENAAAEELEKSRIEVQKTLQIAQNRNGFRRFISDMEQLYDALRNLGSEEEDIDTIKRDLHTLKGIAGAFMLTDFVDKLHKIEDALARHANPRDAAPEIRQMMPKMDELLSDTMNLADDLFGADFMRQGQVRILEFDRLRHFRDIVENTVSDNAQKAKILEFIDSELLSIPIFNLFLPFKLEAARLAERQGKAVPMCTFVGDNIPLVPTNYGHFFETLVHVARNIVDHGIEAPEERKAKNKSPHAKIQVDVHKTQREGQPVLHITITDDGTGIDVKNIKEKLTEKGLFFNEDDSDENVLQRIFDPDFSTRDHVTEISGQGVGLNAVKQAVREAGGRVRVTSDSTVGETAFRFELPYLK